MFGLRKAINWTKSSVVDDKYEMSIYKKLEEEFLSIDSKIEEYLKDLGYEDTRLHINFNGALYPLEYLKSLSSTISYSKTLTIEEKAIQMANLERLYIVELEKLKHRIIDMACAIQDNIYLAYINSRIRIINSLLKENLHLIAIQRSGVTCIDSSNNTLASQKYKKFKDTMDIRVSEIEYRLASENIGKKFR